VEPILVDELQLQGSDRLKDQPIAVPKAPKAIKIADAIATRPKVSSMIIPQRLGLYQIKLKKLYLTT
jgi:hypothetical protein